MEDSSDEEEFNDTASKEDSKSGLIDLLGNDSDEKRRKFSTENLLEKENNNSPTQKILFNNLYMNKLFKMAKNSGSNRLIRSMQNLFDRSRSNSADCLENSDEKLKKRQAKPPVAENETEPKDERKSN